jgi:hypothetical protein
VIVHVVMIQPRATLEKGAVDAAVADLEIASREIPSIKRLRVGQRIRHGLPGYEQSMEADFTYVALIEFDDQRGLEEYLRHPSHTTLSRHFAALGERTLAYDYDVSDVGKIQG